MLAAESFLNALVLNPRGGHLWFVVQDMFMKAVRKDLAELAEQQDPSLFKDVFKLVDPKNLVKPDVSEIYKHELL